MCRQSKRRAQRDLSAIGRPRHVVESAPVRSDFDGNWVFRKVHEATGELSDQPGFRAAIAEYPGGGMDAIKGAYCAYSPILLLIAGNDEEVSPERCEKFAKRAKDDGNKSRSSSAPAPPTTSTTLRRASRRFRETTQPHKTRCARRRHSSRLTFSSYETAILLRLILSRIRLPLT